MKSILCGWMVGGLLVLGGCGGGTVTPPPVPSVTLSASASSAVVGQTVTLTWSAENVTACTASSSPTEGDWSGAVAMTGSRTVSPGVAGAITYSLACTGAGGNGSKSVMVQATTPVSALAITSANARAGIAGLGYGDVHTMTRNGLRFTGTYFGLLARGGSESYVWSWTAAAGSTIPAGMSCCDAQLSTIFPVRQTIVVHGAIHGTPTVAGTYHVVVTVKDASAAVSPVSQNFTIMVGEPSINTTPAPTIGTQNSPFAGFNFVATGGVRPLTWSETGTLPDGLALNPEGVLSGTTTKAGPFPVSIKMTDAAGNVAAPQDFTLQVLMKGFAPAGSMGEARQNHTATLLASGKVLVAGGSNATGNLATAELFDAGAGTFSATGKMGSVRVFHTATLLHNGKVLITGGEDATGTALATAELYDPAAGTFASTGSMATARRLHTATLLVSGKVLVAGGHDATGNPVATAEIFDPVAGTFSPAGSMAQPLANHAATLLGDGRVLIVGGGIPAAQLYDPKGNTFSATGACKLSRGSATATLLPGGKVVIVGGGQVAAEVYDPTAGTFSLAGNLETVRGTNPATLLGNGKVLVPGGSSGVAQLSAAEVFDPATGTFARTADLTTARSGHTATTLGNGQVLVTGGSVGNVPLATAELYQ
jgi:hypothetical protein